MCQNAFFKKGVGRSAANKQKQQKVFLNNIRDKNIIFSCNRIFVSGTYKKNIFEQKLENFP
jgi:hypothetical protein